MSQKLSTRTYAIATSNTVNNDDDSSSYATIDECGNVTLRLMAPHIGMDNSKIAQQFYCMKPHLDVEYDQELVKRMRVINLNAMTCLRMPIGFKRFLSYFSIGNISNAGRAMTRTHGARESYIPHLDETIARVVTFVRAIFDRSNETLDEELTTIVTVNEIPVVRTKRHIRELFPTNAESTHFSLWAFILAIKSIEPGAVVVLTRLGTLSYHVNVRIAHGIPLAPANVFVITTHENDPCPEDVTEWRIARGFSNERYATSCASCDRAFRSESCLSLAFPRNIAGIIGNLASKYQRGDNEQRQQQRVLPVCREHVWFSRHELALYYRTYETMDGEPRPLVHEIACHGLLSMGAYVLATDISKKIVSINAHRRSLRVENINNDRKQTLRDAWALYGNGNGKFVRLFAPKERLGGNVVLRPLDSIELMFAFGDYDSLNCEDGYVLSDRIDVRARALFRKKIIISMRAGGGSDVLSDKKLHDSDCCDEGGGGGSFRFVARMTIECDRDNGTRLYVGTLYTDEPINIPCGNDVLVYRRCNDLIYDIFLTWSASYVQSLDDRCGTYHAIAVRRDDDVVDSSTRTHENNTTTTIVGCARNNKLGKNEKLWYEEREYDESKCPVARASLEVFPRHLLVSMETSLGRHTLKLQNSFGQKGVAHYANLDDFVTDRREPVDVISSMYSFVGRAACGQLLEQRNDNEVNATRSSSLRTVYSRSTGQRVSVAGKGFFFVSNDSPHNQFIYNTKHGGSNPMRMCKLTYEALLENSASSVAFVKSCDFESSISNAYSGMPRTVRNALDCYGVHRRALELYSQRTSRMRKRIHDASLLRDLARNIVHDAATSTRATAKKRREQRRRNV